MRVGLFIEVLNMAKKAAKKGSESPTVDKASDVIELQLVEVLELFTVGPGMLMTGLSDDQFRRRKNRLSLVDGDASNHSDKNVYKSDEGLQFKVGERLMLNYGAIDKAQRAKLNLVD